jgi:phasin
MSEPRLEIPAELRNLAERTIEQAEQAFDMFFSAANQSMASIPFPAMEISKKSLSLTEQNMKAAFDNARKLVRATDLQQAMQIQSEFLKNQIENAGQQMKQMTDGIASVAKDVTEGKFRVGASN